MKKLILIPATALLLASTGCSVVAGALLGAQEWRGEPDWAAGATTGMGTSVVCLGASEEVSAPEDGAWAISGRVRSATTALDGFDNLIPCWSDPAMVLTVEDDAGVTWQVGYAWIDPWGYDATPGISAGAGDRVDVLVREDLTEGSSAVGLVVTDARGDALYALESGRDGQGLREDDIPGLTVSHGAALGSVQDDCGERESFTLRYESATESLEQAPGEDSGMEVGGDYFVVCNIDSFRYSEGACDDSVSEASFVIFR